MLSEGQGYPSECPTCKRYDRIDRCADCSPQERERLLRQMSATITVPLDGPLDYNRFYATEYVPAFDDGLFPYLNRPMPQQQRVQKKTAVKKKHKKVKGKSRLESVISELRK